MIKSTQDITTLEVVVSAMPNILFECVWVDLLWLNVYQESELSILYTLHLDYEIRYEIVSYLFCAFVQLLVICGQL